MAMIYDFTGRTLISAMHAKPLAERHHGSTLRAIRGCPPHNLHSASPPSCSLSPHSAFPLTNIHSLDLPSCAAETRT